MLNTPPKTRFLPIHRHLYKTNPNESMRDALLNTCVLVCWGVTCISAEAQALSPEWQHAGLSTGEGPPLELPQLQQAILVVSSFQNHLPCCSGTDWIQASSQAAVRADGEQVHPGQEIVLSIPHHSIRVCCRKRHCSQKASHSSVLHMPAHNPRLWKQWFRQAYE